MSNTQLAQVLHGLLSVIKECPDYIDMQDMQGFVPNKVYLEDFLTCFYNLLDDLDICFLETGINVDLPFMEVGFLDAVDQLYERKC